MTDLGRESPLLKNCGLTLLVVVLKGPRNIHDTDAEGFAEGCTNVLHMDEKWKFLFTN